MNIKIPLKMTDSKMKNIIDNMVILVDTREQKNQHIIEWFDENNIKWKSEKLDSADYSFILPDYSELGFDKQIMVERKGSINEIIGNLLQDTTRFRKEFERMTDYQRQHINIVLEDFTIKKVLNGTYISKVNPKAIMGLFMTFMIDFKLPCWFITKAESGFTIYSILKYELKTELRKIQKEEKNNIKTIDKHLDML